MELNETSSDKNTNADNAVKINIDQTNQVGNLTDNDLKANEKILDEEHVVAKGPAILDKKNLTSVAPVTGITSNYFCFDCGAVLTTIEDKKQHELVEIERKNRNDLENSD